MKRYIILVFLLVVFSYNAVTQTTAPEIMQIVVNETGDVALTWMPNASKDNFDHSEVWYQQSYLSGFHKIPDSESPYYISAYYKHSNAWANSRQTSYYVVNYDSSLEAFNSEVVRAIYLTACFTVEKIQLEWNLIHPSWTKHAFHIYRQTETDSAWEFVDSTYNTSYQDMANPNAKSYAYRVFYKDAFNPMASASNITNPISYFEHHPVTPSITSLEIHPDGVTAIKWEKSPSNNVTNYIIYRSKASIGWEELGRTNSPDTLNWLDKQTAITNCEEVRTYAVAPVDNCGETGTTYPDSSRSTLVLYPPEYDVCNRKVKLTWQHYESMQVDRYEIYVSDDNGSNFVKYAEVSEYETEYFYTDIKKASYCFKISAIHERGIGKKPQTIISCQYCVDIHFFQDPKSAFFRYISVIDNNIQICFEVDTTVYSPRYRLERSNTGIDGTYEVIAILEPTGSSVICTIDSDPVLKTQQIFYHYILNTLDICGNEFSAEKIAQSILLTATEDENHHAVLEWNNYEGYMFGLDHYIIHRYINGELDNTFSLITTFNSFTDIDLHLSNPTMAFAYRITAISFPSYTNKRDTAFSNITPLKRLKSDIWFPNAFSPAGSNKIFRPIYAGLGIEVDTYEFIIFDRYGAAIYQTNKPGDGWDGRINGSIAATGGYGYLLKIKVKNGDRIERRGSMILIN